MSEQNCWNCEKNKLSVNWEGAPTLLGVCYGFRRRLPDGKYEERPPKAITPAICDMGCLFWVKKEKEWPGQK